MAQEKPQKPQPKPKRPKSKKLNVDKSGVKKEWERILREVDKDDIPIEMLDAIMVTLQDGTQVNINIKELLAEGADPDSIRDHIDERLNALDHIIDDVDFYISVDSVKDTVQSATDLLLKDL
jgi:hypothetical protein